MGRTQPARAFLEELIRKKQECNRRRQVLERYLQKLHEKYLRKEIPYSRYIEILHKKTENRTIHEWIEYYEDCVKYCEEGIKKQKRKLIVRNIPIYFLAFIFVGLLISSVFYITPVFIGFLVQEPTQTFTETLNLQFNQSSEFEWIPKNLGTLNSVKLSGSVNGKGNIKVYLDDFLILSNSEGNSNAGITGGVIEEINQNYSLFQYTLGLFQKTFSVITGRTADETLDSSSENINEEASQEDLSPSQEASSSEEQTNIQEEVSQTEDLSPSQDSETKSQVSSSENVEREEPLPEEQTNDQEETLPEPSDTTQEEFPSEEIGENITEIPEEEPIENITEEIEELNITEVTTEDNVTEEVNVTELPEQPPIEEKPKEIPDFVRSFTDLCEETCDLSEFNLNKTSYTLRIEISNPNTKLKIDEIIYEIFTETLEVPEEPIENITIPEENITEIIPLENLTGVNATIKTTQFQAILGQPVKWKKEVKLDKEGIVKIKLPKDATNISVFKLTKELREELKEENESFSENINEEASQEDLSPSQEASSSEETSEENITDVQELEKQLQELEETLESLEKTLAELQEQIEKTNFQFTITGGVIGTETGKEFEEQNENKDKLEEQIEKLKELKEIPYGKIPAKFTITAQVIEEEKGFFLFEFFKNIFRGITGLIVDIEELQEEIEVTIADNATSYEIEYETPAPYAIEESITRGKRVKIVGPEDIHYQNVFVFTNLSESLNIRNPSSVKVHWIENNTFIQPEQVLDLNSNGIYDYVSWVIPELSNQTFDIIVITKAEHLDSNREFISDIYEEVKALDGVWSETIPENNYVRVTFEIPLDSSRDITIYPRTISGSPRIEVYEFNSSDLIAEFTSLTDTEYNTIFLTNLIGEQDTFDLKILDGDIELDHVVDPITTIEFVSPTPANATTTSDTNITINVSIVESNMNEVIFNWNGTNYTIFNDSLLLMMNFDNVSALGENETHVVDLSGKGNNGTVVGGNFTVTDTHFGIGRSMQFDGSDDYIDAGTNVAPPNAITICAWAYERDWAFGADQEIIVRSSTANTGNFVFEFNDASRDGGAHRDLNFGAGGTSQVMAYSGTGSVIDLNEWNYLCVSYSNSDGGDIYVNGVSRVSVSGAGTDLTTNSETLFIGGRSGSTDVTNGLIDEVRIWNRSLSAAEIQQSYFTNLRKYDTDKWYLYVNQSLNSTDGLTDGVYTYQAFASDVNNNLNQTEQRTITIGEVTDIISCQTLSTAGATYTLQNDITGIVGNCFNITANNITLDGNGFTIDGDDTDTDYGVYATGRDNLTIKNFFNITDFFYGIYFEKTNNSLITNNTANSNDRGITIFSNSVNNTITNNTANSNAFGILLSTSSKNTVITNNTANSNALYGIRLELSSNNNTITNNTANSNAFGILLTSSDNNKITNNTANSNTDEGIRISASSGNNQLLNNQITGNTNKDVSDTSGNSEINYLIYNNSFGEIRWANLSNNGFLKNLTLIGNIGLTINLSIGNNTVFLNAGAFTLGVINSSANITLYGMDSFSFTDPIILRNGVDCGSDCYNFTALNVSTIKFNVTYAGANYSIGEGGDITSCQTLSTAGATYILQNDILGISGTCFTITADNITLDGNGFTIDGDDTGTDYGINTTGTRNNLTIKNFFNITEFYRGIRFDSTTNSLITNNTITNNNVNSNSFGISLATNSDNNQITNNIVNSNNNGIQLFSSSNNTIKDNTMNSHVNRGIEISSSSNDNTITNNTMNSNFYGILIQTSSDNNQFLNNEITGNSQQEIFDNTGNSFNNSLIYNNSFGEIRWTNTTNGGFLKNLSLIGNIGLTINLSIGNNTAFLNAGAFTLGLINSSANITLYGMDSFSFTDPVVLRNGLECTNDECYNFTALNASTIKFNVTYAGANYSIGESADTDPPTITIDSPTNTTFTTGDIDYNITLNEALDFAFYSIDGGSNLTLDNDSNTHYFNISGNHPTLSDGFHNITFWVNDTAGNGNTSTLFFTVDTTPPNINFTAPTPANATTTSDTNITINVSIVESNMNEVIFNWNGTNYTIFNDSLLLMMNFDNVSALGENETHVVDLSGKGNNGTVVGGNFTTTDTHFNIGRSMQFDGSDDYVDLGDFTALDGATAFTVAVWIYKEEDGNFPTHDGIFARGSSGQRTPWIWGLLGTQSLKTQFETTTGGVLDCNINTNTITANAWTYIVLWWNGTTCQFYENGVATNSDTTTGNVLVNTDGNNFIGRIFGFHYWNGKIDEVAIWNRSLSATEIQQLYFTNLNKYDTDKWLLYVNQSLNSTDGLTDGDYTYQAFAQDNAGNLNQTEERTITIQADLVPPNINFTFPTPENATTTSDTNVTINVSITESDLNEVIFNWNGTNYTIFNDSLVLMMNFDNVSALGENNTHVVDLSGKGNNGTVVGGNITTTDTHFNIGRSMQFDGVDDYVNVSDSNLYNIFSSSMWIKLSGTDTTDTMILSRLAGSGAAETLFTIDWNDNSCAGDDNIYSQIGGPPSACSGFSAQQDTWYHLVSVFDGSTEFLYIDGILRDSVNDNDGAATGNWIIGAQNDQTRFFEGQIDEVQIWNRSLSATEIQQLYFTNLRKYDTDKWLLYVNQSLNNTDGLTDGTYTYQAFASDTSSNLNQTEQRTITIDTTLLTSCQTLSTAGATYILQNDILGISGTCFTITADNITLDGNGFTIDGDDTGTDYGVIATGRDNITIKNFFNITDFGSFNNGAGIGFDSTTNSSITNNTANSNARGIDLDNSDGNMITNNTLNSNSNSGVQLLNSDNNQIIDSTANSNTEDGFDILGGLNNQIINSTANSNKKGIDVFPTFFPDSGTFININVINNTEFDFFIETSDSCDITFTNVTGTDNKPIVFYNSSVTLENWNNNVSGIILCNADNSVLDNITLSHIDVENNGIVVTGTDNSNFRNLNINDSEAGIWLVRSNSNNLTNNTFTSNRYGAFIDKSDSNILINITSSSNSNAGIALRGDSNNNQIRNSTLNSNIYGIYHFSAPNNNIITSNTISLNSYGLYLLLNSKDNQYLNNKITGSTTQEIFDSTGNDDINYLIYNNSFGDIRWNDNGTGSFLRDLDLVGNIGLDINLTIGNNTAFLNAGAFTLGLINSSANITLYGMDSFSFTNPTILRNGANCGNDCYNFTALNASTIKFNVTYAGANYSIGEGPDTTPPTITIDSPTNTTFSTGDIDYNITLDEALDFAFYSIDGGSNLTLDNDSNTHYFNISGNHPTLSDGFHNITFWVNDTSGNANESTVFFTVDTTLLTSCQTLSTAGATYTLQNDILGVVGNCFNITANNIILDGNGFTIDGDDTDVDYGVYATNRDNLIIKNFFNITDFDSGIYFSSTTNSLITNNTANSNSDNGILLNSNSNNNQITNNTANSNTNFGIYLVSSPNNNQITNNIANSNTEGIYLFSSSDNQITNNTATSNFNAGILLDTTSNNNQITNNTATSNQYGIYLVSSSNNTITNNTATSNSLYGIRLSSSSNNNQLLNNEITGSTVWDIWDETTNSEINYLIYNNSFGEIKWANLSDNGFLKNLSIIGNIGLTINLSIGNNTAFLNAGAFTLGLINSSANITLYGMDSFSFTNPVILRNGVECGSDCVNFTALNVSTIKFNVTYAGANYSIGEDLTEDITSCQTLSTAGTTYTLQNDITGVVGNCFNITADDITLDGNGFTIDGDDTDTDYGVYATGRDNLTIKNFFNITDFNRGILFTSTNNSLITNNKANSNSNRGISLESNSNNNQVTNNNVSSNTFDGIVIEVSSNNNTVTNNTANSNAQYGIHLNSNSNNNTVTNNTANSNFHGIRLNSNSNNNLVTKNTANSNSHRGISLEASSNNQITNNIFNSNSFSGIQIAASSNNTITNNTLNSNDVGILLFSSSNNNQLLNNEITESTTRDIDDTRGNSNLNYLIYNNSFGEIRWNDNGTGSFLRNMNLTGNIGLTINLSIGNNTAFLNAGAFTLGLINSSANITLYGMDSFSFTDPIILRNGADCGSDCVNFTALNVSTIKFNVTYAGANYTIGEGDFEITSCQELNIVGATYTLQNDITGIVGNCFNITADDITLDGNRFTIDGDDTGIDSGVYALGRDNLTIKNFFNITDFRYGIYFNNTNNSIITNNTANSNVQRGIQLSSSSNNNQITNNTANSNDRGIQLDGNSNNNQITDNTVNSNAFDGIRFFSSSNNTITNNTLNSNNHGIKFTGTSSNNQFLNNEITGSTTQDIVDGTGNTTINYLIYNNSFGEIKWNDNGTGSFLRDLDLIGNIGLTINLSIGNNTAFLNARAFTLGLINSSANITLYGMDSFSFTNPTILRNGLECSSNECYNFTPLNASTIKFNVTYAGANYSIGEDLTVDITSCQTLDTAGTTYVLQNNITTTGSCFTITANNIVFDGNGFTVEGDGGATDRGVQATGRDNLTIKNFFNITGFDRGIYFSSTTNSLITNNTLTNPNNGIFFLNSNDNTITNNTLNSNNVGISLSGSNNTQITNNTANSNTFTGIYFLINSNSNQITNNTFNLNVYGIYLESSSNSNNNQLLNNEITGSTTQEIFDNSGNSFINYLIYNNSFGEIRWNDNGTGSFLRDLDLVGNIGLGINLSIGNNTVFLNAGAFTLGLINSSANITLFGMDSFSFTDPIILRNGADCGSDCVNFTALNVSTIKFNVTYAGANYSIGEGPDTTPPTITIDSPTNATFSTGDIDYNITLNEALDYAFYSIDSGSNLTLDNDSTTNYFNLSGNHPTLSDGFHNITFWVNDTSGNANEGTVFFTVDTTILDIALVCGIATCTDADKDIPLKDHINITLGHNVTTLDGNTNWTAWDPSPYDVVVISESVLSSVVANLKPKTIGILTLEGANNDEFELGSGGGSSGGADTDINITNNTHYITEVFSTGVITVTNVTTNLGYMSGWANDVTKLAHYASNSSLAKLLYVEKDGVLQGGVNTSAERRVFFGAKFFASLNSNGTMLFNRSLDWAAYNTIVANAAPTITFVSNISNIDPTENGVANVEFFITMTDSDGVDDLNDSSVTANFTFSSAGEATRANSSCVLVGDLDSNSANYSCTIGLYYFDSQGDWNVTVFGTDLSGSSAINNSEFFQYNQLKAIVIQPTTINFNTGIGSINQTATNDPTLINNTGNFNVTVGNIQINATNLLGETDSSEFIPVANISLDIDNGGSPPLECSGGTTPVNNTDVSISNAILPRGNHSANYGNATSAQEQIYYCITQVPPDISSQTYSTSGYGSWTIKILLSIVVIPIKRRKKLEEITKEFSAEELFEFLGKKLKKKYKIDLKKLIDKEKKVKERIKIPLDVFKQDIGASESLTKYLKENEELRLSEISRLLNRDQRTIGTNYRNSIKKKRERLELKSKETVPIEIFSDRNLSTLESVVYYLKEKGMRNIEIAELLNKDTRNIWTLYSRAVRKSSSIKRKDLRELLKEFSDEEIFEFLGKKLKKKYKIDLEKLIEKKIELKRIDIPLDVFKQDIGASESLTKYLKENEELRLSEISRLLNRDQRTIGTNYRNSIKKKRERLELKSKETVPIEIFSDRNLSTLESVVYYLKEKGMRNIEIAELLNKDTRNIWTLYSRSKNKLNIEK